MKCPTCQATIKPFYKVLLLTRWTSIKYGECGNYAKREVDGQLLLMTIVYLIVAIVTFSVFEKYISSALLRYVVSLVLWLPIITYIDAKTVRLVRKEK